MAGTGAPRRAPERPARGLAASAAIARHAAMTRPEGIVAPVAFRVGAVLRSELPVEACLSSVAAPGRWTLRVAGSDYGATLRDPTWYDVVMHAHDDAIEAQSGTITVVHGCRPTSIVGEDGLRELRVETTSVPF